MNRMELYREDDLYNRYRIPGMLVTRRGTLLAVCEARDAQSDWSRMDILLRRSTDGGKQFDRPILLAQGTEKHPTVNNPVLVEDRNGRIHFLYCEDYAVNGGRVLQRISMDDGLSWSDCRDITSATEPELRNVFAPGPGHGICTRNGNLLVPFWRVPKRYRSPVRSHVPSEIGVLWSRDDGESWQTGDILSTKDGLLTPNETEIAELEDGSLYLNTRLGAGLTYRARAYSKDGCGKKWDVFEPDYALDDPICFGACVSCRMADGKTWLFFANCNSKSERKNVTLRGSLDDGKTWIFSKTVDADRGGYVELGADAVHGRLYVLYEEAAGVAQHLATFNLSELTGSESQEN